MLMVARLFPCAMIVLSLCASVAYYIAGDWRRGSYWILAAGLAFFVTIGD